MFGAEHQSLDIFARQLLGFGRRAHGARDGIERTSRAGDEMTRAIAKTECKEIHDGRPPVKSIAPGAAPQWPSPRPPPPIQLPPLRRSRWDASGIRIQP